MKYNPEEELKQQGLKRMEVEPFSETGTHTIQHEQTKKISIEKPVIVPKPTPEQVVKKPPVNIMQMLREKNLGGPTEDESAEFLRQQAEAHAGVRGLEPVKEEEKGPTRRSSFAETQAGTEMPFGEEEVKTRAEEIPDEKSIQNQKNYVKTLNDELKNMRHGENKTILPGKGTKLRADYDKLQIKKDEANAKLNKLLGVEKKGEGKPNIKETGLYNDEIDQMMEDDPTYLSTICQDELPTLVRHIKKNKMHNFSFIMNTLTSTGTNKCGHWIAINGNPHSLEIYDPLCEFTPSKKMKDLFKDLFDDMYNHMLKFKVNQVKQQSDKTATCVFHSMLFLKERHNDISFKKATEYPKTIHENELKIKKMREMGGFGYI